MNRIEAKRRERPFTILFVCTANICRSPMAEGILKHIVSSNELKNELGVISAGVFGVNGQSASPYAQEVSSEAGIDISGHRSQPVTKGLLRKSDLVLTMEPFHKSEIDGMSPASTRKTFLLKEYGRDKKKKTDLLVEDPYGGTKEVYEICFREIQSEIERILPEIERCVKERRNI